MEQTYVLWHTTRAGWLARSGTTTTDLQDASTFPRREALKRSFGSADYNGVRLLLPVALDDVQ